MYRKDMWENALKLAKRRDEILSENPDMPVAEALNMAYKEFMKSKCEHYWLRHCGTKKYQCDNDECLKLFTILEVKNCKS